MKYEWVFSSSEDVINLNNISHIWIQKCPNGYFLMGEMINNCEEVVMSQTFESKEECMRLLNGLF